MAKKSKFAMLGLLVVLSVSFLNFTSMSVQRATDDKFQFTGCTPGDDFIKIPLNIPTETKIDFIRWDLILDKSTKVFSLDIVFGESQPNTLGFKRGMQAMHYRGQFVISKNIQGFDNGEVYELKSEFFKTDLSILKLNDNVLHLLTPEKKLMVGNGGWSYTLNNQRPNKSINSITVSSAANQLLSDTTLKVVYEGRTPCQELAVEHNMKVSSGCFKLKWKLILLRDAVTRKPATYSIRKVVDNVPQDVTGNWMVSKGTTTNPDAVIFQLDPENADRTISLLAGDENTLFFLHKDQTLLVGNNDFSFTLNRSISDKTAQSRHR